MHLEEVIAFIANHIDDSVMVCDSVLAPPGPRILWCNPAFTAMTGYTLDEVRGRSPRLLQGPDTDRAALDAISEALRQGAPVRQDVLNHAKSGAPMWIDLGIKPVRDETGRVAFFVALQRDVTARKRHELDHKTALESLRKHIATEATLNARITSLAQNAPGALYQIRVEPSGRRRLTFHTRQLTELFGVDEIPPGGDPAPLYAHIEPEDFHRAFGAARASSASLTPFRAEYRVNHPVRGRRWLATAATPRREADGSIVFDGHVTDISEKMRALEDATAARAAAEAANLAKTRFLANMSHEIRTPLNGILGMAALLERAGLTPPQQRMVRTILASGRELLAVMSEVLELSCLEDGPVTVERAPFTLRDVLKRVARVQRPKAAAKGLSFGVSFGADAAESRIGDAQRIAQVLHHLVDNAIKFTAAGAVRVDVVTTPSGEEVAISVSDTGVGIDAGHQAQIFEDFAQIDAGDTRRFGGAGLGLSISRRLAAAMGGAISVQSAPGAGASFTLRLPLPPAAQAA